MVILSICLYTKPERIVGQFYHIQHTYRSVFLAPKGNITLICLRRMEPYRYKKILRLFIDMWANWRCLKTRSYCGMCDLSNSFSDLQGLFQLAQTFLNSMHWKYGKYHLSLALLCSRPSTSTVTFVLLGALWRT